MPFSRTQLTAPSAVVRPHTRFTIVVNHQRGSTMAKYLISFPSAAMVVPDDECEVVDRMRTP